MAVRSNVLTTYQLAFSPCLTCLLFRIIPPPLRGDFTLLRYCVLMHMDRVARAKLLLKDSREAQMQDTKSTTGQSENEERLRQTVIVGRGPTGTFDGTFNGADNLHTLVAEVSNGDMLYLVQTS